MASIDKKKQSKLIKSVVLNVVFSILFSAFLWLYVYNGYASIDQKTIELNDMIKSFSDMKSDGIDGAKYQAFIAKFGNAKRPNEWEVDNSQLTAVLKKPSDAKEPYMEWVKNEMASVGAYDKAIETNSRVIGNILPTFNDSPSVDDSTFSKNRITLRSLVKYVEEDLLKKYNLESYSTVGLSNIVFEKSKVWIVNIGSYKLNLELTGTNNSILALLDAVQNSGKLPLKDGKIIDAEPSASPATTDAPKTESELSNLLMTIDSAQFDAPLVHNDAKNKIQVILRFYVRGQSYGDFIQIRNELATNVKILKKNIGIDGTLCADEENEFCKNTTVLNAVNEIKALQDEITTIDQNLQASLKTTTTSDIVTGFDNLYGTLTTYNVINANYTKNHAILEAVRRPPATTNTSAQ